MFSMVGELLWNLGVFLFVAFGWGNWRSVCVRLNTRPDLFLGRRFCCLVLVLKGACEGVRPQRWCCSWKRRQEA